MHRPARPARDTVMAFRAKWFLLGMAAMLAIMTAVSVALSKVP